eukprot:1195174-Prorocentrum_minimum.AAC.1
MQFIRSKALPNIATRALSAVSREVAPPVRCFAGFTEQGVPVAAGASHILPNFSLVRSPASLPLVPKQRPPEGYSPIRWSFQRGMSGNAGAEFEIRAPFLSDQVPIANGLLGEVEEICYKVGDIVKEGDSVVILETHKASLHIKAEKADKIKIIEVLVEEGQEIYELQAVIRCVPA